MGEISMSSDIVGAVLATLATVGVAGENGMSTSVLGVEVMAGWLVPVAKRAVGDLIPSSSGASPDDPVFGTALSFASASGELFPWSPSRRLAKITSAKLRNEVFLFIRFFEMDDGFHSTSPIKA